MARIAVDLSVLRESRDLRLLTIGQACSGLGTQAVLVAVPYQVFTLTHSAFLVGVVGAAELVPLTVFSLLGGAWADRFDRRRLMLVAQLVVAAVAALLTVASLSGRPHVALVIGLAAALAGAAAIVSVTRSAAVPALAGDRLKPAVAITFGVSQLSAIVGPGLGGVLIAAAGVESVYALDAVGFLAMLTVTVPLRALPPNAAEPAAEHPPVLRSIAEGLRFVRGNRPLVGSFAMDLAAMTFGMPRALFPILALTVYHAGATGTGLLYASVSAGATLAAVTTGWVEHVRRLGRIVIGAVVVWGLAIAAAGVAPSLPVAMALLATAGAADSVSAVCRGVIDQQVTPEPMRGRMTSVFMLVVTSGPRLGDVESGLAASLLPVGVAVTTGGLGCIAAALLIALAIPELAAYDGRAADEARAAVAA